MRRSGALLGSGASGRAPPRQAVVPENHSISRNLTPLLIAVGLALCVACTSEPTPTPTPDASYQWRLTAPEVVQLFNAYACPGSPSTADRYWEPSAAYAITSFQVLARARGQGIDFDGLWAVSTRRGTFTMREQTGIFVPDGDAGVRVGRLNGC